MFKQIDFNYYITLQIFQSFLESTVEMKASKLYAPPAQKKTNIYFIDDLSMVMIDTYGTKSPMSLLA
jgi:hypothetical protein